MKYPVFKKMLAVMTAVAVAVTPMTGTVLAEGQTETKEAVVRDAEAGVLETALSSYDFADFSKVEGQEVLTRWKRTPPGEQS